MLPYYSSTNGLAIYWLTTSMALFRVNKKNCGERIIVITHYVLASELNREL